MDSENILQSLQKLVTLAQRLDAVIKEVQELKTVTTLRIDRADGQIADLRERLARLEATREADRMQAQAELARFKAEVERAEMRLNRVLPPTAPEKTE